jgi:hypothetical protein
MNEWTYILRQFLIRLYGTHTNKCTSTLITAIIRDKRRKPGGDRRSHVNSRNPWNRPPAVAVNPVLESIDSTFNWYGVSKDCGFLCTLKKRSTDGQEEWMQSNGVVIRFCSILCPENYTYSQLILKIIFVPPD